MYVILCVRPSRNMQLQNPAICDTQSDIIVTLIRNARDTETINRTTAAMFIKSMGN